MKHVFFQMFKKSANGKDVSVPHKNSGSVLSLIAGEARRKEKVGTPEYDEYEHYGIAAFISKITETGMQTNKNKGYLIIEAVPVNPSFKGFITGGLLNEGSYQALPDAYTVGSTIWLMTDGSMDSTGRPNFWVSAGSVGNTNASNDEFDLEGFDDEVVAPIAMAIEA